MRVRVGQGRISNNIMRQGPVVPGCVTRKMRQQGCSCNGGTVSKANYVGGDRQDER